METSKETSWNELPEGCIATALSFTTPQEVSWLSAVSPMFKSAAESDVVWERFLPSDLESILSTSPNGSLLLASASSRKELYFSLCGHQVLVDNGRKSFSLEKKSGKKCYMLSARDLSITWGNTPQYWTWNSNPTSRFPEVAELLSVCWLEIRGKIDTTVLSPATVYTAYLVLKLSMDAYLGLEDQPVEVAMKLDGEERCSRTISWNAQRRLGQQSHNARRPFVLFSFNRRRYVPTGESDRHYPKEREDGWLEIELGGVFIKEGEDGELEIRVFDGSGHWKRGLIVEGMEIRPRQGERGASPSS